MEVVRWYLSAGLIAFAAGFVGLAMLAAVAFVFDRFDERETKLTTPLPMTDQQPSVSAGICGLTSESEISTRANGGLVVRRKIRVTG